MLNTSHRVDDYLTQIFKLDDPVFKTTEESIRFHNMPEHSVSPVQGQFLSTLVHTCLAKRIVEIGTLGGYSTIWLARALPENGSLVSIEIDPNYAEVARHNLKKAGVLDRVEVLTGNALEILPLLEVNSEPADLLFMDADKANYVKYFNWGVKVGRKGGLIVADNVIREGKILDTESRDEKVIGVQNYLEMLAKSTLVHSSILQTVGAKGYDGMAVSVIR